MIRFIGLLLVLAGISGCTILSKQNRISIEHKKAEYGNDACGLYSTRWFTIGRGNLTTIKDGNFAFQFCSLNHYSDPILQGFIVPFLPTSLSTYDGNRLVRIKNTSAFSTIKLKEDFLDYPDDATMTPGTALVKFCPQSTNRNCKALSERESELIELKPGQSIWVMLPDQNEYQLNLYTDTKLYRLRGTNKRVYSVWVLTR